MINTGTQITKELFEEIREQEVAMIVVPVNKFPVKGAFSDKDEVVTTKVSDFLAIARRMFRDFCR